MKNNIYKTIIKFSIKYKMQIILLIIVPQIIVATYNYYNHKNKCLSVVKYKVSSTIISSLSLNEMYEAYFKAYLNKEIYDIETFNNQFIIKNDNPDLCNKIVEEILNRTANFNDKVREFINDSKTNSDLKLNNIVNPLLFFDLNTFNTVEFISIVNIQNKNQKYFIGSKLILVSFLFSILLIILLFLKKNIKSF